MERKVALRLINNSRFQDNLFSEQTPRHKMNDKVVNRAMNCSSQAPKARFIPAQANGLGQWPIKNFRAEGPIHLPKKIMGRTFSPR
jgi:hypothetical protein